jgi:hypothetical protein
MKKEATSQPLSPEAPKTSRKRRRRRRQLRWAPSRHPRLEASRSWTRDWLHQGRARWQPSEAQAAADSRRKVASPSWEDLLAPNHKENRLYSLSNQRSRCVPRIQRALLSTTSKWNRRKARKWSRGTETRWTKPEKITQLQSQS